MFCATTSHGIDPPMGVTWNHEGSKSAASMTLSKSMVKVPVKAPVSAAPVIWPGGIGPVPPVMPAGVEFVSHVCPPGFSS